MSMLTSTHRLFSRCYDGMLHWWRNHGRRYSDVLMIRVRASTGHRKSIGVFRSYVGSGSNSHDFAADVITVRFTSDGDAGSKIA